MKSSIPSNDNRVGCPGAPAPAVWALGVWLAAATAVSAGHAAIREPLDAIRDATHRILAIVADPALQGLAHRAEREDRMMQVVDAVFDWQAVSRRSLGRHWPRNDAAAQKEFVRLFRKLIQKTYLAKVEGYSGEKVVYNGEKIDGDYARVSVTIIARDGTEIPVIYRMRRRNNAWRVYDVSIAGVSLVNNYRSQFNSILIRSSFEQLLVRLRKKVEK